MASEAAIIGAKGEDLAVEWLRKNGWMIVARNWRCGRYELDIVAQKGFTLHFVEVKSRLANGWSTPEDAITESKTRATIRAASSYLASYPTQLEVQLDLIAVDFEPSGEGHVRYIAEAMQCNW